MKKNLSSYEAIINSSNDGIDKLAPLVDVGFMIGKLKRDTIPLHQPCSQLANNLDSCFDKLRSGNSQARLDYFKLFIPVIITTAPLICIEFDEKAIKISNGIIREDCEEKKTPWLIFRWYHSIEANYLENRDLMRSEIFTQKMKDTFSLDIAVVNAEYLQDFLKISSLYMDPDDIY